ncbi:MAG TPA: hypothetical protein VM325_15525 [Alphaproteobacteria bacterium]|nr:hypothetical protein [Alphaproteobacteria bacterium]
MDEPNKTRGWRALGRRAAVWLIFLPVLMGLLLLIYLFISSGAMLLEAS